MKPTVRVLVLILVAVLVGTLIGRSTRSTTAPIGSRQALRDAGMDRMVPTVRFDNLAYEKALDALRETTHTNIACNWRALEAAGIDRQTPVQLKLDNVPLSQALALLLDDVGGGGTVRLGFQADDGVIRVSTAEDLDKRIEARVYEVRDLIIADTTFINSGGGHGSAGTGSGQSMFSASQPTTAPARTYEDSIEQLMRVITDAVEPDSWRENGGIPGSIRHFDGLFIITQTPANHQAIADLLEMIRDRGGSLTTAPTLSLRAQ